MKLTERKIFVNEIHFYSNGYKKNLPSYLQFVDSRVVEYMKFSHTGVLGINLSDYFLWEFMKHRCHA